MGVIQEIPANATFSIEATYRASRHFNEMIAMLSMHRTGDPIKDKWVDAQIEMYVGYEVKLAQLLTTYEIHVQPAGEKPVVAPPAPKKPWYPDDSGEWVEVVDGRKPSLPKGTRIVWLTSMERSKRDYFKPEPELAENLSWSTICAYKVAK